MGNLIIRDKNLRTQLAL